MKILEKIDRALGETLVEESFYDTPKGKMYKKILNDTKVTHSKNVSEENNIVKEIQ